MTDIVESLGSIRLYFVLTSSQKNEKDASSEMKEAYKDAIDWCVNVKWISELESLKINSQVKGLVFVFPTFEGDTFDAFIESHRNSRVIGPRCLLSCFLNQIPIPNSPSPVYFMAMIGLHVAISNVPKKDRKKLEKLVGYMGGIFNSNLTTNTTHLAVDSVLSEKYFRANKEGIRILKRTWIEDVWEENLANDLEAVDPKLITKHNCPIFFNLKISVSLLNETEKIALEKIITANGGMFTRELFPSNNILLIPRGEGTKFKYAKRWNLKCIHPDWVKKCIEKGYAVQYDQYLIQPGANKSSTPLKSCNSKMDNLMNTNDSDLSAIPSYAVKSMIADSALDSQASSSNNDNAHNIFKTPVKNPISNALNISYQKVLDNIVLNEVKKCGTLLDGCKVFLMGFNNNEEEKLRRILNYGGAMRFTELNESVTHIIVGKLGKNELEHLQNLPYKPHVVAVHWLSDSIKKSNLEREHNYSCLTENDGKLARISNKSLQPSPLSKKGLQILNPARSVQVDPHKNAVDQHLIGEYSHFQNTVPSELPNLDKNSSEPNPELKDTCVTAPGSLNERLFEGLRFSIIGHTPNVSEGIKRTILDFSGIVVSIGSRSIVDYTVVPLLNTIKVASKNEIVTSIWMEECLLHNKVIDIKYYHRPISVPECSSIELLKGCVITFSAYDQFEKQYLGDMAAWLGATCQDVLSKKTNPERNVAKTTHLVCSSDKGAKVIAAKKWNLPIVREQWLMNCLNQCTMLPIEPYLLNQLSSVQALYVKPTPKPSSSKPSLPKDGTGVPEPRIIGNDTPSTSMDCVHVEQKRKSKLSERVTDVKRLSHATPALMNAVNGAMEKKPSCGYSRLIAATKTKDLPTGLLAKINSESSAGSKRKKNHSPTYDLDDVRFDSPRQKLLRLDAGNMTIASQEVGWRDTLTDITPIDNIAGMSADLKTSTGESSTNDTVVKSSSTGNGRVSPAVDNDICNPNIADQFKTPRLVGKNHLSNKAARNMMISVPNNERKTWCENIIESLGGRVMAAYQPDCKEADNVTHLIIDELKKTEKLLCSISSGLWVLHSSYLVECHKKGHFVNEEGFEWGNPLNKNLPTKQSKEFTLIAKSAHRWRKRIQKEGPSKRPFVDMKAVIISSPGNIDTGQSLARVVRSGGGVVLPPSDILRCTHCLLKSAKNISDIPIKLQQLAKHRIHCLLAVYLSDYLILDPPPKPEDVYFEEFKRYLM